MKYLKISDHHTHSVFSFDGKCSCRQMIESALAKGLYSIAITDHCDIEGPDYTELDVEASISASYAELQGLKEEYQGRIRVLAGIELGQAVQNPEKTRRVLEKSSFDFVLCSLHNLRGEYDFADQKYESLDLNVLLHRYLTELLEHVKWNGFDSLAHLDYPLRYISGNFGIPYDLTRGHNGELVDEILVTLARNGKALEVNTSGLFQPVGRTLPGENIIRRFVQLGGKHFTVGTDSHLDAYVGRGVEAAYDMLRSAGVDHVVLFENRQMEEIRLPD